MQLARCGRGEILPRKRTIESGRKDNRPEDERKPIEDSLFPSTEEVVDFHWINGNEKVPEKNKTRETTEQHRASFYANGR